MSDQKSLGQIAFEGYCAATKCTTRWETQAKAQQWWEAAAQSVARDVVQQCAEMAEEEGKRLLSLSLKYYREENIGSLYLQGMTLHTMARKIRRRFGVEEQDSAE